MNWLCKLIGHKIGIKQRMIHHTVNGRDMVRPAAGSYPEFYCKRKHCTWKEIE